MNIKSLYLFISLFILLSYFDATFELNGVIVIFYLCISIFVFKNKFHENISLKSGVIKFGVKQIGFFLFLFLATYLLNTSVLIIFSKLIDGVLSVNENYKFFYIIQALLISPILEELVFRKYILNYLLNNYSFPRALIISSICFAICHTFSNTGIFYAFIGGVFLGFIYYRTNNIVIVIIFHSIYNLLDFLFTPILYKTFQ